MTETEHERHEPPLDPGRGRRESLQVAGEELPDGQEQEHVHRDEDDEHAVPAGRHPVVLHRNGEEREEQCPVVRRTGGQQRDVLLHGPVAHEREEGDRHEARDRDRTEEDRAHDPPGANTICQLTVLGGARASAQDRDNARRDDEKREHKQRQAPLRSEAKHEFPHERSAFRMRTTHVHAVRTVATPNTHVQALRRPGTRNVTSASDPTRSARSLLPIGPS